MMRIVLVSAVVLMLAGCATEAVSTQAAAPVPSNRILAPNLLAPSGGSASLILKRDSGLNNMACNFRLSLDGRPFADISSSEKVQIFVQPGEHIIGAETNGICLAGNAEASTTVAAQQVRTYRVSVGSGGELKLQPTAF